MSAPTAVGAYIFAGGFTLGVKRAGFEVLAQLEDGLFGVATTQRNHPELAVHTIPAGWPTAALRTRGVDFIYGNPPCAPFSLAGVSTLKVGQMHDWWKRDPRVSCIHKLFSLLETVRPRVWAWESVQMAWRRGRELVDELTEVARHHGYSASYVLLNAAHLGVPQVRRRLFCVFHDVRIEWRYNKVAQLTTVRDALAGLEDPSPEIYKANEPVSFIRRMRPGEGPRAVWERDHPDEKRWKRNERGHVIGRPGFNARRLRWDQPSYTMIGGAHLFHPEEHRLLSVREAQVLCGYPASYQFVGNLGDKYAQIARAVMPPVGTWLAKNVKRAVESDDRIKVPEVWLRNLEQGKEERIR